MFITQQYTLPVSIVAAAATADVNAATGINAGGPYNGAVTAITAAGVQTAIAAGVGVAPLITTRATLEPFTTICNYYTLDLTGINGVAGQPLVMKLTHFNLDISEFEYILDYKLTCVEVGATSDLAPLVGAAVVNYSRAQKAFFVTIPAAALGAYTAAQNLILAVVFGRQN